MTFHCAILGKGRARKLCKRPWNLFWVVLSANWNYVVVITGFYIFCGQMNLQKVETRDFSLFMQLHLFFYKNNFIRTRGIFLLKI